MSSDGPRSGADGEAPEPTVSQRVHAAGKARVLVAGRNQYILTPGNVFSVTVPAVLIIISFFIYQVVSASGSSAAGGHGPGTQNSGTRQATPVKVTLSYDQNHVNNGAPSCVNWVVPRPISAIQAPQAPELDETYAHQFGGIDEGETDFKLDVQGTTPNAVELIDFRVVDIKRTPVSSGTDILSSDGCGPSQEAGFYISLGSDPPAITPVSGLDNGAAKKIPFPFVVSSTDIQQFQVAAVDSLKSRAAACNCLVRWRLALDWSYEGRTGTTVIDDNGQPFQTIFPSEASSILATHWWDNSGAWSRQ